MHLARLIGNLVRVSLQLCHLRLKLYTLRRNQILEHGARSHLCRGYKLGYLPHLLLRTIRAVISRLRGTGRPKCKWRPVYVPVPAGC